MPSAIAPRVITSVLVEEDVDSVTVTWGLGDLVDTRTPEYFGYGMYYYDSTGNGGKRFGVRFSTEITAWVFEHTSVTRANYQSDSVSVGDDAVVVHYRDASLGLRKVGTITAYAHVNGDDTQVDLPVVLVR